MYRQAKNSEGNQQPNEPDSSEKPRSNSESMIPHSGLYFVTLTEPAAA